MIRLGGWRVRRLERVASARGPVPERPGRVGPGPGGTALSDSLGLTQAQQLSYGPALPSFACQSSAAHCSLANCYLFLPTAHPAQFSASSEAIWKRFLRHMEGIFEGFRAILMPFLCHFLKQLAIRKWKSTPHSGSRISSSFQQALPM